VILLPFITQWGHVVAAMSFSLLALWLAQRLRTAPKGLPLCLASCVTVCWALSVALIGPRAPFSWFALSIRDLFWLIYMHRLWSYDLRRSEGDQSVKLLYGVLTFVIAGRALVDLTPLALGAWPRLLDAAFFASIILRMISDIGALVLLHNLYTAIMPKTRDAIRLPIIAISVMWAYDLNLFTVAYLAHHMPQALVALRGPLLALLAPLFALGVMRAGAQPLKLSRTATFQSLSLVAIGGYLIIMVVGSAALQLIAPHYVSLFQVSFVFVTSLAALILLPNARLRATARVLLSKHFFQHRYDYRAEWLRFTDTLGRQDGATAGLHERTIKAVADITESDGGLLLTADANNGLIYQAHWNWDESQLPGRTAGRETLDYFRSTRRIFEIDSVRNKQATDAEARAIPEWLLANARAWVIVPLIHFDELKGLVVLDRPLLDRPLDWEDFDLLRVAGRQVASYLAEAMGQQALSDAQRFDEFNRRFAFIIHDIKNLVSQLSLVTRNAERHIGNPEFQRDMLATIDNSAKRMNDLLAKLSQHNQGRNDEPRAMAVGALVEAVAASKRAQHPIVVSGDTSVLALADPARLEQALGHLLQNAIDASAPAEPVTVHIDLIADAAQISIIDTGAGMSADFVQTQLFKPFASTKDNGFGIGAYEAQQLIIAMGGRLSVRSRPGAGSTFTIKLPHVASAANLRDIAA
jgi:putative PEP-CTERM system histidine kinase